MSRGNILAFGIFGLMLVVFAYFFISAGSPQRPPAPPTEAAQPAADQAEAPANAKQWSEPPAMTINPDHKYVATIDTTKGKIACELFAKDAPVTVNNFVFLAHEEFYNGTKFHRVLPNFMIQGGDPTGTGRGGPGYMFQDEVGTGKPHHQVGTLSMANAGPNTNGSQFFITHVVTDWLDGKHTVFGQTIQGQDVVNAIQQGDKINSITIEDKSAPAATTPTTNPK